MKLALLLHVLVNLTGFAVIWGDTIWGSGSSFGGPVYTEWMTEYNVLPKWPNSSTIGYVITDSAIGRQSVIDGTYYFGGTDTPITNNQLLSTNNSGDLILLPAVAGPIVVSYNLPELAKTTGVYLNLSREAIAGIFVGDITMWNDPAIASLNGAIMMPNQTIRVIVRGDSSGTTQMFTSALSKFSSKFQSTIGPQASLPNWPTKYYAAKGNGGVARKIYGTEYSIGYLGIDSSKENEIPYATIRNIQGKFVRAEIENVEPALSAISGDFVGNISQLIDTYDNAQDVSYPIVGLTYFLLYKTTDEKNCENLREVARFLFWSYTSKTAKDVAYNSKFVPLSGQILNSTLAFLKNQITCTNAQAQTEKLYGKSVCDTGCVEGSCTYPYFAFQPRSESCHCTPGWKNVHKDDCSEPITPFIMDSSRGSVVAIIIITTVGILATAILAFLIYKHQNNPVIKASSPIFCLLALNGVLFAFINVFTFIGVPSSASCVAQVVTLSLSCTIFFGTVFSKTFRIYKIFHKIQVLRGSISTRRLLIQSGSIVSGTVILLILFIAIDPPTVKFIPGTDEVHFECFQSTFGSVIKLLLLVYNGVLILSTTFLAIRVRKAKDAFSESISLGISIYSVSCISLFYFATTFIPSLGTETKFILRAVSSLCCAFTVLAALFAPKLYRIFFDNTDSSQNSSAFMGNSRKIVPPMQPTQNLGILDGKTEVICWNFYCKDNSFFGRWKEVKLNLCMFENQKGSGFIFFQDTSESGKVLHVHRLQDTQLIWDKTLVSSNNKSMSKDKSSNADNSFHNFARLVTSQGSYDLQGQTPPVMAALVHTFPFVCDLTDTRNVLTSGIAKNLTPLNKIKSGAVRNTMSVLDPCM